MEHESYVGLENADAVAAIDTLTNAVIATIPIGQGPQGVAYVPGAVPIGDGLANLSPIADAAKKVQLLLTGIGRSQVTLFDQGQVQILQAAVGGLAPKTPYVLGLAPNPAGTGAIQPLAKFMTSPSGSAVVNAVGPIRQIVTNGSPTDRRYLVVALGTPDAVGAIVQVQQR